MKIFNMSYENNYFEIQKDNYMVLLKMEEIPEGYILRGKIKGKIDKINIFEDIIDENIIVNDWHSWGETKSINIKDYPEINSDYFILSEKKLIGFLSSNISHNYFEVKNTTVYGYMNFFEKKLDDYIDFDPLIIIEGKNPEDLLEIYADYVKFENNIKLNKKRPVGWSSWYQYFDKLNWEDVKKNLELSQKYGYEVFQIDDSWQKDIGDWESKNNFPSLKEMAEKIKSHNMTPGIWTAPFNVSETSQIFINHQDWLIKDENGNPKIAYKNWNKNIYTLDITNPDVQKHLYTLFKNMYNAGFEYFKIDFLYSGAIEGKRFDNNITPIESYRKGLEIIRYAVKDSFILGCGAPLLPSLGYVDGMRVSEDTAPIYTTDESVKLNAYIALKNSINRFFMNEKWWWNDPDCLILRKKDTQLDSIVRQMYGYATGLLNYMIIQSDNLSLDIEEDIYFKVLELQGGIVKVKGIMDGNYIIESIHPKYGKITLKMNLEEKRYNITFEDNIISLNKKTIVNEDKRLFHFYTLEGENNA
ncbi:alpha-galactosidase [Marinitoga piezophila KA3]|uniref:Alpha-galactosidase n=1 Tax=Marinitoga piezophila (strain DSM 14283 / JCM 11233 / KA3) TaxID=443254 RepID=H2J759_MARPK|nr:MULTISPECIES: glycoside hydrolase family 36 protein [Marinitoga]AEX86429.1 alpha-galactosidase [Marinitoga piezophila KA3]APT76817.1 alpha-galactosidase [Marinitoga sp. 1137]